MLTLTQHSGNSMFNQRTVMSLLTTIRLLRLLELLRYLAPHVIITTLAQLPAYTEGGGAVNIQLADGAFMITLLQ